MVKYNSNYKRTIWKWKAKPGNEFTAAIQHNSLNFKCILFYLFKSLSRVSKSSTRSLAVSSSSVVAKPAWFRFLIIHHCIRVLVAMSNCYAESSFESSADEGAGIFMPGRVKQARNSVLPSAPFRGDSIQPLQLNP